MDVNAFNHFSMDSVLYNITEHLLCTRLSDKKTLPACRKLTDSWKQSSEDCVIEDASACLLCTGACAYECMCTCVTVHVRLHVDVTCAHVMCRHVNGTSRVHVCMPVEVPM